MAKGYWIAHVKAEDGSAFSSDSYKAYVEGAAPAFKKYNAKFLARGGEFKIAEGADIGSRHVIAEFESFQAAQDCYNSDIYADAKKHRQAVFRSSHYPDGRL